jgi:peptide/nickel transport system ATP-binding protein
LNSIPLIDVKDLTVAFEFNGEDIEITDKISFKIFPGEIYGIVGESGCGKTVTALSLLRLLPMPGGKILSGSVMLKGQDTLSLSSKEIRDIRGSQISMIFQEPSSALNPLLKVEKQLMELFDYHEFNGDRNKRVKELLKRVGFPDPARVLSSYPHELSGGMLQRVMIAMSLIMKPCLIIADEPTTALDVTVQAQIMELLVEMKGETDTSILLITHNLGLIAQYADRLSIMYAGRIVEESSVESFLNGPLHPYTKGLLRALPKLDDSQREIQPIPGQVPQPKDYEKGCRFRERCEFAFEDCCTKPVFYNRGADQSVACFLYKKAEYGDS